MYVQKRWGGGGGETRENREGMAIGGENLTLSPLSPGPPVGPSAPTGPTKP